MAPQHSILVRISVSYFFWGDPIHLEAASSILDSTMSLMKLWHYILCKKGTGLMSFRKLWNGVNLLNGHGRKKVFQGVKCWENWTYEFEDLRLVAYVNALMLLSVVLCASKAYYKETKWETFLKFGTLPSWNFSLFELIKMGKFSHMSQPFNFYKIHLNFNLKLYESQTFSLQTIGREESSSVSLLPHLKLGQWSPLSSKHSR